MAPAALISSIVADRRTVQRQGSTTIVDSATVTRVQATVDVRTTVEDRKLANADRVPISDIEGPYGVVAANGEHLRSRPLYAQIA